MNDIDVGQFSLFDLLGEDCQDNTMQDAKPATNEKPVAEKKTKGKALPVSKNKAAIKVAVAKPQLPDILKKVSYCKSFHDFLELFGYTGICMNWSGSHRMHYHVDERDIFTRALEEHFLDFGKHFSAHKENRLVYVDNAGNCWQADIKFNFFDEPTMDCVNRNRDYMNATYRERNAILKGLTVSAWSTFSKLPVAYVLLQTSDELDRILNIVNPYGYTFAKRNGFPSEKLLMMPFLETLYKAGFALADRVLNEDLHQSDVECFNRLCKRGGAPKEIFKTTKPVYTALKEERNLKIWDSYRKMDKFGQITQDVISRCYDANFSERDLTYVSEILSRKYHGKQVLSWDKLILYLERLDTYEAISKNEALPLIRDYLNMCRILNIAPRIDGDSLKREHDVAARLVLAMHREEANKDMLPVCEKMAAFNYSEQIYFVRAIRDDDDLLDEATQQRNCLASYAGYIAKEKSYIYVMREVRFPERSLVSIELDPRTLRIRQKFMACNQPIRNRSISEFIDRWVKFVRTTAGRKEKTDAVKNSLEINAA